MRSMDKTGNRPGGDDPQRRAFGGVIMPEIGLRAPGFNCQPAADADEDDQHIGFEICARNDGNGHEKENAKQQPVHVQPPGAVPIYIREIFFGERPPDVNDQKDGEQESAKQNGESARVQKRAGDWFAMRRLYNIRIRPKIMLAKFFLHLMNERAIILLLPQIFHMITN